MNDPIAVRVAAKFIALKQAEVSRPTPLAGDQQAASHKPDQEESKKLFHEIKPGSKVTIMTPQGQEASGKVVMRGPAGWVLNMGGAHGRPGIATPENVVRVK